MRVRYKRSRTPQVYESKCLVTTPRYEPPPAPTGPQDHCEDCPYPAHGFVCWGGGTCLRTEMTRITERDRRDL